jgi:capsular polysaccharide transport system permease protein
VLERDFADKNLMTVLSGYEQALTDARNKRLYLERIVQPNLPDVATEPRRMRGVLATFLLGLILWGTLTILIAGLREHRD